MNDFIHIHEHKQQLVEQHQQLVVKHQNKTDLFDKKYINKIKIH